MRADKHPPQNLEAELSVLGSILLDNTVLDEVATFLAPADFFRGTHEEIYDAILALYRVGIRVDAVTLAEELGRRGRFAAVGGDETLAKLIDAVPSTVNATYHAQIVKQKATARAIIKAATEILEVGYANDRTAEDLVEHAERLIFSVSDGAATTETVSAKAVADEAIERAMARKTGLLGIPTGLAGLDARTDGLFPGQLVVLAARPSMGKTQLALNFAEYISIKRKRGVLFVSLEMAGDELGERLVCARSLVPNQRLRAWDSLRPDEVESIGAASAAWDRAPLNFDVSPARTTLQIMAGARRMKARGDLGLVIVDYLQLITPSGNQRESRTEAVARISRELKRIARELKVPVIALSQLNRASENREDKRPRMADLRESGAIEQDADVVLMLHRPDYYDKDDRPGEAELIIAKNRNGPTLTVPLGFVRDVGRFTDLAPPAPTF